MKSCGFLHGCKSWHAKFCSPLSQFLVYFSIFYSSGSLFLIKVTALIIILGFHVTQVSLIITQVKNKIAYLSAMQTNQCLADQITWWLSRIYDCNCHSVWSLKCLDSRSASVFSHPGRCEALIQMLCSTHTIPYLSFDWIAVGGLWATHVVYITNCSCIITLNPDMQVYTFIA